jgi:ubiquinone/menaquinone biosynthesis C-methylase UbiE
MPNRQSQTPNAKSPPTAWSDAAHWYDQLVGESGSEYQQKVVFPGVLRLLALSPGEQVLDLACGQGALCRLLRDRGAAVTGVDASHELIRIARKREIAQGLGAGGQSSPGAPQATCARLAKTQTHYVVGDARKLDVLWAGRFDAAACVLAIQNIYPIEPVFAGVARALREGGRFVLVMMHPCFRSPKHSSWGWDEQAQVQYRRVDRYLLSRKEPIVTQPGADPGKYTWSFHRPLQSYARALSQSRLLIDAIEEWPSHKTSGPGPRASAENAARKEIPLFLAIRAIRHAAPARD